MDILENGSKPYVIDKRTIGHHLGPIAHLEQVATREAFQRKQIIADEIGGYSVRAVAIEGEPYVIIRDHGDSNEFTVPSGYVIESTAMAPKPVVSLDLPSNKAHVTHVAPRLDVTRLYDAMSDSE